jgi:DNA-binding YbaB/EbfC family protein
MNQQAMMRLKKLQKDMLAAQEKLEQTVFTGTAGGGAVEAKVKGNHEVVGITIDPEVLDDVDMLQDLIALAINDANKKVAQETQKTMGAFGGGLGLF